MKVWNAIFNLFAVLIIAIMIIVINKIETTNLKQFEEVRMSYAIDYATEAAFRSCISTDTVGTDYIESGLEEVRVNPTLVLDTFCNVLCMSYDLSRGDENFNLIKQSIATSVLCGIDGYYVLEPVEVDTDPYDVVLGGEYDLKWGIKRPYLLRTDEDRLFALNIVNEQTIEYNMDRTAAPPEIDPSGNVLINDDAPALVFRTEYDEGGVGAESVDDLNPGSASYGPTGITEEMKLQAVSEMITEDINIAINKRNLNTTGTKTNSFYMPASNSLTAINQIKSPTLIVLFQDSEFLNGYHLDAVSVGGNRVRVRTHVIGFTIPSSEDPTEEYYCFAGQQLGEDKYGETKPAIQIIARFDTMHEAAEAGFSPHFYFLNEPIFKEDKNTVTILH